MIQLAIATFTSAGLWLVSSDRPRVEMWGWFLLLCGQPFWLVATWQASQWGMLVTAVIITIIDARGLIRACARARQLD